MSDKVDDLINELENEQVNELRKEAAELKIEEARVLIEEKRAKLAARKEAVKGTIIKGKTNGQLLGTALKGLAGWTLRGVASTVKSIHTENVRIREMEARRTLTKEEREKGK